MNHSEANADLRTRIDALEAAYERFLGYAARGTDGQSEQKSDTGIRPALQSAIEAIEGLTDAVKQAASGKQETEMWIEVIDSDAKKTLAALHMVFAQPAISSQLIDNLNASIHLRALLTDLFVIDEVLKVKT